MAQWQSTKASGGLGWTFAPPSGNSLRKYWGGRAHELTPPQYYACEAFCGSGKAAGKGGKNWQRTPRTPGWDSGKAAGRGCGDGRNRWQQNSLGWRGAHTKGAGKGGTAPTAPRTAKESQDGKETRALLAELVGILKEADQDPYAGGVNNALAVFLPKAEKAIHEVPGAQDEADEAAEPKDQLHWARKKAKALERVKAWQWKTCQRRVDVHNATKALEEAENHLEYWQRQATAAELQVAEDVPLKVVDWEEGKPAESPDGWTTCDSVMEDTSEISSTHFWSKEKSMDARGSFVARPTPRAAAPTKEAAEPMAPSGAAAPQPAQAEDGKAREVIEAMDARMTKMEFALSRMMEHMERAIPATTPMAEVAPGVPVDEF